MEFDIAVIGGGPGGYFCAIRAAQLGLKVALIEKKRLGGTCLNIGCIPTKSLLQTMHVNELVIRAAEFGVRTSSSEFNLDIVLERTRSIVDNLEKDLRVLMVKNEVAVIKGAARFKDKNTLIVDDKDEVRARNIVIATGAKPRILPGLDERLLRRGLVWTSERALSPNFVPKKLLIAGSGAIGVELASFYNIAGSVVTIAEIQDRILASEDKEISRAASKAFVQRNIGIKTNAKLQNFRETSGGLTVDIAGPDGQTTEQFDVVICAVGVVPNVSDLSLEAADVEVGADGAIKVFAHQQTSQASVFAIGDAASAPRLAHKASREGIIAAEWIAHLQKGRAADEVTPINLKAIPSCTYSSPQIASIGLTEEAAKASGACDLRVGRAHFMANGKARILGESDGFVKLIFDGKTGELLGAHMIGTGVTELIATLSVAIAGELTEKELMAAVFPHPTVSEMIQEAVYDAFGVCVHG